MTKQNRILLIDDDKNRFKWFKDNFDGVVWADTYKNALSLLNDNNWDFVFFDHDLGDKDGEGIDLAKHAVKNGLIKQARIVVHSMNPVGARNIANVFERGYDVNVISYKKLVDTNSK